MKEPWRVECFLSGTQIVTDGTWPHYYVYGPGGADEGEADRNRYRVCCDLRDYLNGGERPAWLDDLVRVSESHAEALDHTSITATGPMIDADPPKLHWVQDDSDEAKAARARLMDALFLGVRK